MGFGKFIAFFSGGDGVSSLHLRLLLKCILHIYFKAKFWMFCIFIRRTAPLSLQCANSALRLRAVASRAPNVLILGNASRDLLGLAPKAPLTDFRLLVLAHCKTNGAVLRRGI